jgi:hypothetical protein
MGATWTEGPAADPICFVFVCQQGEIEAQAALLATSIRRWLPPETDIVAAIPGPAEHWGAPAADTLALFERLSVRVASIANRVGADYPIGNKIDCPSVDTKCRRLVFLDSDMLVLRAPDLAALAQPALAAVPASGIHVQPEDWPRFYAACDAPQPSSEMLTLLSGEHTPPYFNAGFIAVDCALGPTLAEQWAWCARRLRALSDLPAAIRRRFLDQVALPIAAARMGTEIVSLAPEWNFPSWGAEIGAGPLPAFFHYQDMPRLLAETPTRDAFRQLIADAPDLAAILERLLTTGGDGARA